MMLLNMVVSLKELHISFWKNFICRKSVGQMLKLIAERFKDWDTNYSLLIHLYLALRTNVIMKLSGHYLVNQRQMVMGIPGLLMCSLPNFLLSGRIAKYKDGMYIICHGNTMITIFNSLEMNVRWRLRLLQNLNTLAMVKRNLQAVITVILI